MNEEKMTDMFFNFTEQLASLNTNMESVLSKLVDHEKRIENIEQNKTSLKDDVIAWLVKGLVAAVLTVGSLTGAGALITKFFGG